MAINFTNPYLTANYSVLPSLATAGSTKEAAVGGTEQEEVSFSGLLAQAMGDTVLSDAESKVSNLGLITGVSDEDIHNITIASAKADIMLNLTVQIRNKMVEGYQEIMRMQI